MSMKAALTNLYLRTMIKPRLARTPLDVADIRAMGDDLIGESIRPAEGVRLKPVEPVPARGLCGAEWLLPDPAADDAAAPSPAGPAEAALGEAPVVLYTHGGAYCFGSLAAVRPACSYLARHAQARVLSLDYRLAPEHPFPAAVDDALVWYRRLLDDGVPASRIVLAGESAGGGLALAGCLAARDAGLPLPAGIVLFSPWVDLGCSGASLRAQAHSDAMLPSSLPPQAAALYLAGTPPSHPLASPLFAELTGLPPLLIYASRSEILLDDARRLHEQAAAQGVPSRLHLRLYLPHAWPVMLPLLEARETLREAAEFIAGLTLRQPAGR